MSSKQGRTVAVLGHYHGRNLGDDLVVETILDAIRRRIPGSKQLAISLAPWDTEARHKVPAFPITPVPAPAPGGTSATEERQRSALNASLRRVPGALWARRTLASAARVVQEVPFTFRAYRLMRGVDTVVVAGSGQLLDAWSGAWNHPYAILRWATLARLTGTRFVVPSIGAGPIEGHLGRFMIRRSVAAADYVSVRDAFSAELLHSVGVTRDLPVRPDMAYGYPLPAARPETEGRALRVGVNAMAHEDPRYWPKGDGSRYRAYLRKTVEFVAWLLENGHEVILFSSQTSSDALVAGDVMAALEERGLGGHPRLRNGLTEIEGADDFVRTIQDCDYVVAARFHSILIPLALGIPTIGLAYHAKTQAILAQAGHPEWCLDIDACTAEDLSEAFEGLRRTDGSETREELRSRAAELRSAIEAQFDEVLLG
jgi:polysaccharide pyruvyl transferase WcaK-like protein